MPTRKPSKQAQQEDQCIKKDIEEKRAQGKSWEWIGRYLYTNGIEIDDIERHLSQAEAEAKGGKP